MKDSNRLCTVFEGDRRIASGTLAEVAGAVMAASVGCEGDAVLIFDDDTGRVVDLDVRGTLEAVLERLRGGNGVGGPAAESAADGDQPRRGPGRPPPTGNGPHR